MGGPISARAAPRRRGVEAEREVVGGGFVDPVAQLVVDVPIGGGAARQHAQPVRQMSPEGHQWTVLVIRGVDSGARRPAGKREERAYGSYVSDEQRRQTGCPARKALYE